MNRVNAPDTQESGTIHCQMANDNDIIDLIEKDPNLQILEDEDLEDVFSLVTGQSTDSISDQNEEMQDLVSSWVNNGENSVHLSSTGTAESSYLVDGVVLPLRFEIRDGDSTKRLFVEGKKLLWGAEQMQLHDPATVSIPYLDTTPEGILHVIPGWSQREIIEDISYRFKAGRVMETEVPFLGGIRCKKRSYECHGVMVCPKATLEFREKHHDTVQECNEDVFNTISLLDEMEVMKRNALHIFREVTTKKNYCSACFWSETRVPKTCDGKPVIRERRGETLYGNKHFLGCTGYHRAPKANHTLRKLNSLDDEGVQYLRGLLAGEIRPHDFDVDKSCSYVHGKKRRGTSMCQVHKEVLIHIPCNGHRMHVFEPIPQAGVDVPKMVYVSCFGSHTHPPPPPPDHTLKKMKMLEAEVDSDPFASSAVLRKRVEEKVMRQAVEGKRNGAVHVPIGSGGRKIRRLRERKRRVISDAEGLMALAVDQNFPYCRDIRIVGPNIIVTCANDAMLMHASLCDRFAGDATFKTISRPYKGQWYLYNIIAPARRDGGNSKSVVVFRALMTGLAASDYRVVWRCFFREIIACRDIIRGDDPPGSGVLKVPYQQLPPALMKHACFVSSVTMDFETTEVLGCAQALGDVCGGSVESHINGLLIGCGVHLDRDLRRRSLCPKISAKTTLSSGERLDMYRQFLCSDTTDSAMKFLADVEKFDTQWVRWVKTSGLLPLVCKVFSHMTSANRANGYEDTNGVESHNRRGNLIAGKQMHPFDAIHELGKIDELDIAKVGTGVHNKLQGPRPPRRRSDYTLTPSGSKSASGKKRRSSGRGGGMGPIQKKPCLSQSGSKVVGDKLSVEDGSATIEVKNSKEPSVSKDSVSVIIHMRVQRMLCQLEMKTISDTSLCDEAKDRRSETITNLLMDMTEVEAEQVERLKAFVLRARLAAIKNKDRDLASELFKVYSEGCLCEDPLSSDA